MAFTPAGEGWDELLWLPVSSASLDGQTIPHQAFRVFQVMFSVMAPALISGAIVGRMTFFS